ncbi:hypothetical protein ABW19_dt0204728 [Dactylella cylindrospora]|nr:hypothetical protein ABW19_dt0204728 [Dactylella cylindrospora]
MENDGLPPPVASRALADIGATAGRRNSNNYTKPDGSYEDDIPSSSPFPSPYSTPTKTGASPLNFWQDKLQENMSPSGLKASPSHRRTSVEKLMRQSKVSNNLFQAPTTPQGAARGASLTQKPAGSRLPLPSSRQNTPLKGVVTAASTISSYGSNPEQKSPSPPKTSILSPPRHDDPNLLLSSPPRSAKQVTFTAAPQVQMFVPTTPEPSVSASENTYETETDEESDDDDDYNMPVVGPEDWDSNAHSLPPQPQLQPVQQETYQRDTPSPANRPLPPLPGMDSKRNSDVDSTTRRLPLQERLEMVMRSGSPAITPERKSVSQADVSQEYFSAQESESEEEEEEGNESFSPIILPEEAASDDEMSEAGGLSRQLSFSSNKENIDVRRPEQPTRSAEDFLNNEFRVPRISRESIRRQVQAKKDQPEENPVIASPEPRRQSNGVDALTQPLELEESEREITMDLATLAEKLNMEGDEAEILPNILGRQASVRRSFILNPEATAEDEYDSPADRDDEESSYSTDGIEESVDREIVYEADDGEDDDESEPSTPTQATFTGFTSVETNTLKDQSLPDLGPLTLGDLEFRHSMPGSTPSSHTFVNEQQGVPSTALAREFLAASGAETFSDSSDGEMEIHDDSMSICGSVIRHQIYDSDDYDEDGESMWDAESIRAKTPSPVPERRATIRSASGMKLKTRKSSTPADIATMAAARREVSRAESIPPVPALPPVPKVDAAFLEPKEEIKKAEEEAKEEERPSSSSSQKTIGEGEKEAKKETPRPSQLALPSLGLDLNMGSSLSVELERVIENQKRGYLMRENSKVVHASTRDEPTAEGAQGSTPKKTQSWTVEPWQGSPGSAPRRRSGRGESLKRKPMDQSRQHHTAAMAYAAKSNDLPVVEENENKDPAPVETVEEPVAESSTVPENTMGGEGAERGRLFVKVIGVKDLALPLPQAESTYFCMTLDNGLHCVTTSWLELGKNAPIGQEFELVVLDDLEFQLSLQTKITPPPVPMTPPEAIIVTPQQSPTKPKSKFGNLFSSPKKRKEQERLLQQQQLQRQQQAAVAAAQRRAAPPSAWDLLHNLVGKDGSFARSYISLKDFETKAYGRPYIAEISCFNEWAVEMSSVKGKKSVPIRKPPYKVGKLEVQLLFVPRLSGMMDTDLPKSMNAAIRELREAESMVNQIHEGYLSQQGGDCPYWRRRYFKLEGSRLTAYHESTRQPRANINLAKAAKVIDDRSTLTNSSGSKKRRKSGFAEDEEGYMFIEEGFRIRFANGECIDFYADSTDEKNGWMRVLNDTVGRCSNGKSWCDHVLKKEREERAKAPPPPPAKPTVTPSKLATPRAQSFQTPNKTPSHTRTQSNVSTGTPNFHQLGMSPAQTPGQAARNSRNPLPPRGAGRPQSYHAGMGGMR